MLAVVDTPSAAHVAEPRGIQNVLLAFDGSPGVWVALGRAIDIAAAQHARLVIAGVVTDPRLLDVGRSAGDAGLTREPDRRPRARARA